MVERARFLNVGIDFQEGDMTALAAVDETWAGITAFYSIIHIPRGDMPKALRELRRVLMPGGLLLLSGILVPQKDDVRAAYADMDLLDAPSLGEWVLLALRRRA